MIESMQTLLERRSCRSYLTKQVEEETLQQILQAGLYAPSARNWQSAVMVVCRDAEEIALLSRLNAAVMGADTDPFYGAPCVVVVLADPQYPCWLQDGSLVMGNLMNAAHACGVGSCWINRAMEVFDSEEGKLLLRKWGVPESFRGVGNCILGYEAAEPNAPAPRKENRVYMR